jgi:glutamine---fructose-6-phosphate transaminase (isomerizing)
LPKKRISSPRPATRKSSPGAFALIEILSQPLCWNTSLTQLGDSGTLKEVSARFTGAREWVFIGCGSSFYVAQAAAASMTALTGIPARAVPASEILLFPQLYPWADKTVPVLISRSGRTSEVLKVGQDLRARGVDSLGISCTPGQALEELASRTILLPAADEQSTVMTRSFTSMLMALQALAATLGGCEDFLAAQLRVARAGEKLMDTLPQRVGRFVAEREFADYVCLGQGGLYGMACESALKLTEMSVSYAQSFHTMEFRHGPKSIVCEDTLVVFLLSEGGYKAELEVLEEIKGLGGTTMVVTNSADARVKAAADFLVELGVQAPEWAKLPLYLPSQQLMGLYTGTKKGLDPDRPRHLSRVVVLENEAAEAPEHAAI